MRSIPDKLVNFTVYRDGNEFLGTADVVLPSFEAMTDTLSGAGIAGEIDSPTIGHFGSMTTTLNWRTVGKETIRLLQQTSHSLDFRGVQHEYDASTGERKSVGIRVSVKALPKTGTLGNFQVGSTTGTSNELEVIYIKIVIDGKEMLEYDKLNFIYRVDGVDAMSEIRDQLGL